eukprot:534862_1
MLYSKAADRLENDIHGGEDVWAFVNKHRVKNNAINHGQGFPNWACPDFVKAAAKKAIDDNFNQYAPNAGLPALKQELISTYTKLYGNKFNLTPENFQITNGCAGATDSTFRAFLNPGDEVIVIEPFFTFYRTQVCQSRGKIVSVALDLISDSNNELQYKLNTNKIKAAITNKTRFIVLNSPHNPTGYVISLKEMKQIANIITNYPKILILTDEVYHYISSEPVHYFASLSQHVFDRTICCVSAAKTFSVTGWKIGWCIAPKNLIKYINFSCRAHCWSVNTPCQKGVADMLIAARKPYSGFKNYYEWLNNMYDGKRKLMLDAIRMGNMKPIKPSGAYYIMVDASKYIEKLIKMRKFQALNLKKPTTFYDWQFAKWLMEEIGVAVVPGSAFFDYSKFNKNTKFNYIRFAYCTSDETIQKTGQKLKLLPKILSNRSKL